MSAERVAASFEGVGATPWDALDACYNESVRFRAALAAEGIDADLVSGYRFEDVQGQRVIVQGHTAVRVGDLVYDWTARQFHTGPLAEYESIPFPLVQPYDEWRAAWPCLNERTEA